MVIGTGYFAKARAYHDLGYALVNVAKKRPWFLPDGLELHEPHSPPCRLAPTDEILALKDKPEEYTERYRNEVLRYQSPYDVYTELFRIAKVGGTDKVALLCYEAPDKFCHRHLIAEWLAKGLGVEVKEINAKATEGLLFEKV